MVLKAVVLVGGPSRGTRFRPLSLNVPKPLFPVAGHPVVYHHIAALSRVPHLVEILIIGFFEDSVFAGFVESVNSEFGVPVRYLREFQALGTAGGLYHFRDEILRGHPSHFYVLHADVCSSFPLVPMLEFHKTHQGLCSILGTKVPRDMAHRYGCLVVKPGTTNGEIMHYAEKPETFISDLISCGVYLFSTEKVFSAIKKALEQKTEEDSVHGSADHHDHNTFSGSPASLPALDSGSVQTVKLEQDLLRPLAADGKLFVFETKDFWRQIKTAGSAIPANSLYLQQYQKTNPDVLAKPNVNGLQIEGAVWIHPTAKVDPTAKLGPNVSIGPRCVIGRGVRIREAIVLDNVEVKPNSLIVYSVIGWNSRIGCWARVEGSPPSMYNTAVTQNGKKIESITILAKDVVVADEVVIRNCIVLPNKELRNSFHSE
ncbi:MAG: nucleotide-diphospho-sugar transferase, partial [Olpidium bornovanus]